jgi:ribosomal protein L11 methyltransferase
LAPRGEEWIEVRVADASNRDSVIAALFSAGSEGVQEIGNEIVTYFPSDIDEARLRRAIASADSQAKITLRSAMFSLSGDVHGSVERQQIGALTIAPPWLGDGLDLSSTIIIEPAMAFGTGEHATTRGVLRLMQRISLDDKVVADLGSGSGILAIAAAKLGARKVIAIELDADATSNATENIGRNSVAERVHFIEGDASAILPLVAPVDAVFANILSSVLVEMLPTIRDSLVEAGKAILSGILVDERPAILRAIRDSDWRVDDEDIEGEWWSVLISRV